MEGTATKKITGISFQPWIGKNYGKDSKRLLLLGESHYLDGEKNLQSDFTTGVVKNFLNKEDMKTPFFRIINLLLNQDDKVWNNLAFANLIQNGLENWKSQPDEDDIGTIKSSFNLLLEALKPNKVLVLSKRMWDYWIPETNGKEIKPKYKGSKQSEIWMYKYSGGKCLAMGIYHPSRMWGNSYKDWIPIVKKFLAMRVH